MKVLNWVSHILCAMLACASLTFEARASASFEDGGSSVSPVRGDASGRTAPSRDESSEAARTSNRRSAHTGAGSNVGPKRRDAAAAPSPRRTATGPPRGAALASRGTAARQHSPPNAQARGRLARQANGLGGSAGAAAGSPSFTGSHGARPGPAGPPKLTASAPPAAPRGLGRVGGPAISRTTHSATVDGTQLRHKF
jgi:hypothetical protein